MGAGWVAGVIRARALTSQRLGSAATHELAASPTLAHALRGLAGSTYREAAARSPGSGSGRPGSARPGSGCSVACC